MMVETRVISSSTRCPAVPPLSDARDDAIQRGASRELGAQYVFTASAPEAEQEQEPVFCYAAIGADKWSVDPNDRRHPFDPYCPLTKTRLIKLLTDHREVRNKNGQDMCRPMRGGDGSPRQRECGRLALGGARFR